MLVSQPARHAYIMMITSAGKCAIYVEHNQLSYVSQTRSPICVILRLINAKQSNKSGRKYHFGEAVRGGIDVTVLSPYSCACVSLGADFNQCPRLFWVLYIYLFFVMLVLLCDLILCCFVHFEIDTFCDESNEHNPCSERKREKGRTNEKKEQTKDTESENKPNERNGTEWNAQSKRKSKSTSTISAQLNWNAVGWYTRANSFPKFGGFSFILRWLSRQCQPLTINAQESH